MVSFASMGMCVCAPHTGYDSISSPVANSNTPPLDGATQWMCYEYVCIYIVNYKRCLAYKPCQFGVFLAKMVEIFTVSKMTKFFLASYMNTIRNAS